MERRQEYCVLAINKPNKNTATKMVFKKVAMVKIKKIPHERSNKYGSNKESKTKLTSASQSIMSNYQTDIKNLYKVHKITSFIPNDGQNNINLMNYTILHTKALSCSYKRRCHMQIQSLTTRSVLDTRRSMESIMSISVAHN